MKRINNESSLDLNNANFESLKPLYGSNGNSPYYDPNDLHSHVWKKGNLGIEDNPKISTYAKGKLNIKKCTYCKICHMVKDSFQSTIGSNRDIITDTVIIAGNEEKNEEEKKERVTEEKEEKVITVQRDSTAYERKIVEISKSNQKLFCKEKGIFDNYLTIEKSE